MRLNLMAVLLLPLLLLLGVDFSHTEQQLIMKLMLFSSSPPGRAVRRSHPSRVDPEAAVSRIGKSEGGKICDREKKVVVFCTQRERGGRGEEGGGGVGYGA